MILDLTVMKDLIVHGVLWWGETEFESLILFALGAGVIWRVRKPR